MNKKMHKFIENKKENWQHCTILKLKDIKSTITVLLGPNGTGKSLSLRYITDELDSKNINYIKYSTSRDDIVQKSSSPFGDWDVSKIAMAFSSEGERMVSSFFDWANSEMLREILTNNKPLYILVDEADSGLSWDRLAHSLPQILNVIIAEKTERNRDIHLVITCNSYEMYEILNKYEIDTIWVPTKQHISPQSYKAFRKLYIEYLINYLDKVNEDGSKL